MGSSGPGSTHGMSRPLKRKRLAVLAAAAAVFLVGGAAILWGRTRLFPDLVAEASAAYSRGEWDRTVSLVHRRLKEAPDDPQALRLAARAAARQDQDQKAITIYQRLAAGDKDAEDFSLLGRAWSRLGQVDSACREFEQARQRDPDHPAALASLAALYLRSDRSHAAAEAAQRLARQPAWEARPNRCWGPRVRRPTTPRAPRGPCNGGGSSIPKGKRPRRTRPPRIRKLLARSLLMSGQPAEARPILQALLAAGPDPEVSWLLSRCFIQEGDWTQAAAVLPQASSFRTEHPLEPEPAPYVGEARCAACHRAQFDALLASRHATYFARRRELEGLPLPEEPLPDPGNPQVTHRFRREDDSLVVETRAGPKVWRAVVDYAFGSPRSLHDLRRPGRPGPIVHGPDVLLPIPAGNGLGHLHRPAVPAGRRGRISGQEDGRRAMACGAA